MGRMTDRYSALNRELFLVARNLKQINILVLNEKHPRSQQISFGDPNLQMEGESVESFIRRRLGAVRQGAFDEEGVSLRAGSSRSGGGRRGAPRPSRRERFPRDDFFQSLLGVGGTPHQQRGYFPGNPRNAGALPVTDNATASEVRALHDTIRRNRGRLD